MKQKTKKPTKAKPSSSKALAVVRSAHKELVARHPALRRPPKPVRQELVLSPEAASMLAGPRVSPAAEQLLEKQRHLSDEIDLGNLGLVEIKLTPEEEAVLAEPINPADIQVKPTGAIYLSHPAYTRWFNRAFGRTGWALVPAARVQKADKSVVQPYVLHVHGKPVAFAFGEQEYFEGNRDQTYGDAIESTVASALRRCAKRLGVGLELWDRSWVLRYIQEHVVKVLCEVQRDGEKKMKPFYRKKTDPPFWNEKGIINEQTGELEGRERRQPPQQQERRHNSASQASKPAAAAAHDGSGDLVITEPQRARLWTIATNAHRTNAEVKAWLERVYHYDSSKDIKRKDYEAIVRAIEAPGPLGGEREPGMEG